MGWSFFPLQMYSEAAWRTARSRVKRQKSFMDTKVFAKNLVSGVCVDDDHANLSFKLVMLSSAGWVDVKSGHEVNVLFSSFSRLDKKKFF